jgi:hypothetical protein
MTLRSDELVLQQDICLHRESLASCVLDPVGDIVQAFAISCKNRYLCTGCGQPAYNGCTQRSGTTRDHRHFAGKIE